MITYNGGKSGHGVYQAIINHIPPHDIYIEAFAGHGGIFRHIRRAAVSVLNDIDSAVIARWRNFKMPGCDVYENFMQGSLFDKPARPIVILRNNDYTAIVNRFKENTGAFIYCDPPYMMETRKQQRQLYEFEWYGEREHILFLEKMVNVKCAAMISHYPNNLYNSMLSDWNYYDFQSPTRGGVRTDRIYFNYKAPEILHDVKYIGENHRQRTDLKRKIKRWAARLEKMQPLERTAILSTIINNYKTTTEKIIKL